LFGISICFISSSFYLGLIAVLVPLFCKICDFGSRILKSNILAPYFDFVGTFGPLPHFLTSWHENAYVAMHVANQYYASAIFF
jgi:hypothetical protein